MNEYQAGTFQLANVPTCERVFDGKRVKAVLGTTTTAFVGGYYEVTGNLITKYYAAGGTRIAMRVGTSSFYWLVADHLGSTTKVANSTGGLHSQQLYKAWGEVRYTSTTPIPTRHTYTGQYAYNTSGANDFGLMDYGARFYDPLLSRWAQADSIVPGDNGSIIGQNQNTSIVPLTVDFHENAFLAQLNQENAFNQQHGPWFQLSDEEKKQAKNGFGPTNPQVLDRYAYTLNSPGSYTDPSGHFPFLIALAAITPLGWVAIGVTTVAVVVYLAVPGVREAVTTGVYDAGVEVSNGLDAVFASKYRNDPRTAGDIIAADKQGRIKSEFPSEMLGKTYDEIVDLAKHGSGAVQKAAQTAKKLLDSKEYDKKQKR